MGRLIVIDGLDGSGKATQASILSEKLNKMGIKNIKVSFPDYESDSSAAVKMYLNGEIGTLEDVNVYAASSFYAVDRYISFKTKWKKYYDSGYVIICDRYATSNVCHQMPKLPANEHEKYLKWLYDYEFNLLGIPSPDAVIYLDMDLDVSQKLLSKRYEGEESKKDIHEKNKEYLKTCRKAALKGAEFLSWHVIRCDDGNEPFSLESIADKVFSCVQSKGMLEEIC